MNRDPNMPLGPLEEYVRSRWAGPLSHLHPQTFTTGALAAELGVPPQTIYRWRRRGIPPYRADELAVELGSHPLIIWPAWLLSEVAA